MTFDIRKFFTPQAVAEMLKQAPEVPTPIMDLVFKDRKNWPMPKISLAMIEQAVGNMPVIRRNGQALQGKSGTGAIIDIEPMPVILTDSIPAAEINNLKALFATGGAPAVQEYINEKLSYMRVNTKLTAEALAAQALTGKIDYPMATGSGGFVRYEVEYGKPAKATAIKKWNAEGITIADVKKDLDKGASTMRSNGCTSEIAWLCNGDVYASVLALIAALPNDSRVSAKEKTGHISLGTHKLYPIDTSYNEYGADGAVTSKPSITAGSLVGVPVQGNKFWYAALDSMSAGLAALPFYAHAETKELGVDIITQSKPLPGPQISKLYWIKALSQAS